MVRLNGLVSFRRFSSSANWKDYQYLEVSSLPTYIFQQSLPRLPIPKLEDTCHRYLAAQEPLLTTDEFETTSGHVSNFLSGPGNRLQVKLKDYNDKMCRGSSYISETWFDKYLRDRTPLPLNYNPMLVFQRQPGCSDQLVRATNFLISSLRFRETLVSNHLSPEVFHLNPKKSDTDLFRFMCRTVPVQFAWYAAFLQKAYPLDMSQYFKLFNSTRIPETSVDRLYQNNLAKHVVVMRNGNFYVFDCFDKNGLLLKPREYMGVLSAILNDKTPPSQFPIGVLTTQERNLWADLRKVLLELGNQEAIETIDSALFVLCLDEERVGDDLCNLGRLFLHSDGKNRWFDKSFSLLVSKEGDVAVNFEHSWGDGVAIMRYFNEIGKDAVSNAAVKPGDQPVYPDSPLFRKLEFKYNDQLKNGIKEAIKGYGEVCNSLDVNVLEEEGLNRRTCKVAAVNADAIMQLAFQDAYYKLSGGKFVGTYESCSTAAYKHGRTETIRPCTKETKAYCVAANQSNSPSTAELTYLVEQCSKKHMQLTKEAAMGQGFDRHLFALRMFAENPLPGIYQDQAYSKINHNIISTSTLPSPYIWAGGFGPSVEHGFGVAYNINDTRHGVLLTSYEGKAEGGSYMDCLREAFTRLAEILNTK